MSEPEKGGDSPAIANVKKRLKDLNENKGDPQAESIPVHHCKFIEVTAKVLREAIKANPEHPIAQGYKSGIRAMPDDYRLNVERADLEALLQNGTVVVKEDQGRDDQFGVFAIRRKEVSPDPPKEEDQKPLDAPVDIKGNISSPPRSVTDPFAAASPKNAVKEGEARKETK